MSNKSLLIESAHIYIDDATGDEYIFDGTKLIKIKSGEAPVLGDKDIDDFTAEEDARREQEVAKERAEDGEEEETEEEKEVRLDKLKKFLNDDNMRDMVVNSSREKVEDEKARKKAAQKRELEKNLSGAAKNAHVIKELSNDIRKFLAKEIGKSARNASWKKYNGNYDNSGIVKPGYRYEKVGKIPLLQIYIDQSGSWDESEIKIGQDILYSILEFERKKQIKTEVYYFANHIHSDAAVARREGGTHAGTELMEQLNAMKPDNVVVVTDADFDYSSCIPNGSYEAPGGVWLVFRDYRSKELMNRLHGKLLTKYYDIDKADAS